MPQAYVEIDLDSRGVDQIKEKTIEGTVKYLKIYKKEIFNFLSDMKGLNIDDVIDELPEEFDGFDTSKAVEELSSQLSSILELSSDKIYSEDPDMDDFDEDNLFEPGEEDLVDLPEEPRKKAPEFQPEEKSLKIEEEDEAMMQEEMEEGPQFLPLEEQEPEVEMESSSEEVMPPVLIEQEEKEDDFPQETINQQFEKTEETVADHLESQNKRSKILELISLNHRYMFIKELFNNDKHEFEHALFELEAFTSFDDSVEFLVQSYAKDNEWEMQSDEVKEFLKVLFRRFR